VAQQEFGGIYKVKLYIDTSDREKILLELNGKKFEMAGEGKSQKPLMFIEQVMKEENVVPEDLTEIEVATGPGSFTGLKIGVAVAQTMGWVLNIPVNGQDLRKGGSIQINY
jgi:tRNA A37 threonylcarbamoyladenosine modification protein TsaB